MRLWSLEWVGRYEVKSFFGLYIKFGEIEMVGLREIGMVYMIAYKVDFWCLGWMGGGILNLGRNRFV